MRALCKLMAVLALTMPAALPAAATDTGPPTAPTGLRVQNLSVGGVTLAWNPSTDDSGWLIYEVEISALPRDLKRGATTEPTARFTSLVPGATYTASVLAVDGDRNRSASASIQFTALFDTTAPTTPGNLRAVTRNGVLESIAWDASYDESPLQYLLFSGSSVIASSGPPSISALELVVVQCLVQPGSTHTLTVQARDIHGNASGRSNPITVTFPTF